MCHTVVLGGAYSDMDTDRNAVRNTTRNTNRTIKTDENTNRCLWTCVVQLSWERGAFSPKIQIEISTNNQDEINIDQHGIRQCFKI